MRPGAPRPFTVDAILLASGRSLRFGAQNKLLAPFCGQPLASRTLRLACGVAQFAEVFFVFADPAVAALARGLSTAGGRPVRLLHNPNPQYGRRESVRLGAAASRADGFLFFPCDQPLLDADTVLAVLAAASPGAIVSPRCGGRPGGPVFFSALYREELCALGPGEHPRGLLRRHAAAAISVETKNPLALLDADTPEELARLALLAHAPPGQNRTPQP